MASSMDSFMAHSKLSLLSGLHLFRWEGQVVQLQLQGGQQAAVSLSGIFKTSLPNYGRIPPKESLKGLPMSSFRTGVSRHFD